MINQGIGFCIREDGTHSTGWNFGRVILQTTCNDLCLAQPLCEAAHWEEITTDPGGLCIGYKNLAF